MTDVSVTCRGHGYEINTVEIQYKLPLQIPSFDYPSWRVDNHQVSLNLALIYCLRCMTLMNSITCVIIIILSKFLHILIQNWSSFALKRDHSKEGVLPEKYSKLTQNFHYLLLHLLCLTRIPKSASGLLLTAKLL